jgi:hypothetical protein
MPDKSGLVPVLSLASLGLLALAAPADARPGGWGGPGWGSPNWNDGPHAREGSYGRDRSREGHVEVSRFLAEGKAGALGHGAISVTSNSAGDLFTGERERAPFEAAVVDRLAQVGYDTAVANANTGQVAELRVTRSVIEPQGPQHKPVSGEAEIGVGNRGTRYGMAIAVDLTKPPPPLVSTRLEARIRDKTTGEVLWEGRADIATREGDEHWSDQQVASRLAEALFDHFPQPS